MSASQAYAGGKYDRKIEQAAVNIAVQKLGNIRGSHEIHEPYFLHPPIEARNAANGTLEPAVQSNHPLFTVRFQEAN
ncbi:MAG: hypothetical protein GY789_01140 [Hyphomicrobiales bacterium]|nr:hypothetical protein [Hyphomicrobiales bacterium]MCP5001780.1 hypothetical protein [Hyphomicrobiales bacterium]